MLNLTKNKKIIFIILTIPILLGTFYFITNKKKTENIYQDNISPPQKNILTNKNFEIKQIENNSTKTVLKINEKVYETEITEEISVYDLMNKLKKEGKIDFKYKTYPGMGKFIEEINGIKNGEKNWIYYVNDKKANIGVSNYKINHRDVVSWKLELGI